MSNLLSQFDAIFNRRHLAVAKITGDLGGGSWAAKTQGGKNVVLNGSAAIGQSVFYDLGSGKISGEAPNLTVIDVDV